MSLIETIFVFILINALIIFSVLGSVAIKKQDSNYRHSECYKIEKDQVK